MDKKARIVDIARELDLAASTVSRALNNHPRISKETKKAVNLAAKAINYQPHRLAAALRNGKSNVIGVMIPTIDRNFFGSIVRGIEEELKKEGYQIMICQTYEDPSLEAAAIEVLLNLRVDGIIATLSKRTTNFDHFLKAKSKGIPVVLFDRSNDELDFSHVIIDDFMGAFRAVDHLVQQGCRRIAHFTNFQKINIYKERLRGYREALEKNGIPFLPQLVIESDMQLEDGRVSMQTLLEGNLLPDAVFSSSDLGAMGALQVLKENNIRVPEEVAIVGFSNEPFTSFSDPPISSVDQHCKRMGNAASEIFLEEIKQKSTTKFIPRKVVFMPELVIRRSSLRS
jgi:LacI family transcriptional regulator